MEIWVLILIAIAIGLIVFFLTRRERFSSGAIQPTCPGDFMLVGTRCRLDGVGLGEDGQCPPGTVMNEEGMCQGQADPICGEGYTLTIEDGVAMCEPNIRPVELTDEENQARQDAATQLRCPAGFERDFTIPIDNLRCMRDTGVSPEAGCPPGSVEGEAFFENVGNKITCIEYRPGELPTAPSVTPPPVVEPPPVTPPPLLEPPIAPPPAVTPDVILPPPTPRELVFQSRLLGTPGGLVAPADTRIGELLGGLFSPSEPRPEPRPSEYTL